MITTAQIAVMGANPDNADVPFTPPVKPWRPWHSPVMILDGSDGAGNPWLYLAGRCGWFLGFDSQHDPAALAGYAQSHIGQCEECGKEAARHG